MVRSLTLVAPCGLVRRCHQNWQARLLYSENIFPEWLLVYFAKKRLRPAPKVTLPEPPRGESTNTGSKTIMQCNSDASGGDSFDHAILSKRRPDITVATICEWQLDHHPGFVSAYMSTMRHAPIYDQRDLWSAVGRGMEVIRNRENSDSLIVPIRKSRNQGKALIILGADDPVIVQEEVVADVTAAFGEEGMGLLVLHGGHEIVITHASEIAQEFTQFCG